MEPPGRNAGKGMSYLRFVTMMVTSTVVMFGLMYLNTYAWRHVEFSQTRMWMAMIMGSTMAAIMLAFMWKMHPNKRINAGIIVLCGFAFAIALWLVRSQETADDLTYMKAMIPHHSIAVMTSERARIRDPEVRRLADGISEAQVREIAQMRRMIARLEANPPSDAQPLVR